MNREVEPTKYQGIDKSTPGLQSAENNMRLLFPTKNAWSLARIT